MLAGVGGIDLVLFVIAADESIKPQTREHFDICRCWAFRQGIVVLTKADLVDADLLELVRLEVDEFVRGSFLEGAPVVAVSSTTGRARRSCAPSSPKMAAESIAEKDASRYFRLPIDRAFTMRGFGTRGDRHAGLRLGRMEQEVELHPAGPARPRARHPGAWRERDAQPSAGQRTALNLAACRCRGTARAAWCWPKPADSAHQAGGLRVRPAAFGQAAEAPRPGAFPRRNRRSGSRGAPDSGTRSRWSPARGEYVRILLSEPLLLLPGDRFIVRMFSPVVTIGGGVVLDIAAPRRATLERLRILETSPQAERLALAGERIALRPGHARIGGAHGLARVRYPQGRGRRRSDCAGRAAVLAPRFALGRRQAGRDSRTSEAVSPRATRCSPARRKKSCAASTWRVRRPG